MPRIHDTPPVSSTPPTPLTPQQGILETFYTNAPPPAEDLEISCRMHFTSDKTGPLEYYMSILINKKSTSEPRVQWLRPLGNVVVSYYTEGSIKPNEIEPDDKKSFNLAFPDEDKSQMVATFRADMDHIRWDEFLIVGVEFPANTIKYTLDTINNERPQRITALRFQTMQKVHLETTLRRDPIPGRPDNSIYTRTLLSESGLPSSSDSSSGLESDWDRDIQGSVESETSNSEA